MMWLSGDDVILTSNVNLNARKKRVIKVLGETKNGIWNKTNN